MQTNENFLVPLKERISLIDYAYLLQKFDAFNAPRQFQRPIAWKSPNRKAFFQSLLMNRAEGTYVFVDIKSCIGRIELIGECDTTSYKFFRKLLNEGYKYIILDGNNRLSFSKSLFNDEYSIPEGKYEYITDEVNGTISSFTVRRGKQKFSDLPERVRDVLVTRQAAVSVYTQITYSGMSEVFLNLNSGVAPNAQEKRNAFNTPWADYVRKISDVIPKLLVKMFKKDYRTRLKGEEWIVDCLDFVTNGIVIDPDTDEVTCNGITQITKDKLYLSDFLCEDDQNFYFDKFVEMMDFIEKMIDHKVLEQKSLVRSSAVQNLFWMMCNGVDTYDQAVAAVKLHELAYKDKDTTYTCGDDEKTFKECCGGSGKENFEFRYIIFSEILKKVSAV